MLSTGSVLPELPELGSHGTPWHPTALHRSPRLPTALHGSPQSISAEPAFAPPLQYLLSRLRDMHTTTVVVYDSNPASILLRACDAALPLRNGTGAPSGTRPPPPLPHELSPPPPPLQRQQPPQPKQQLQQQLQPQPQLQLQPPQPSQPPLLDVEAAAGRTLDWLPHAQHTTICNRARSSRLTSPRRRVDWPGV